MRRNPLRPLRRAVERFLGGPAAPLAWDPAQPTLHKILTEGDLAGALLCLAAIEAGLACEDDRLRDIINGATWDELRAGLLFTVGMHANAILETHPDDWRGYVKRARLLLAQRTARP